MSAKRLMMLAASISLVALWGCSSSMDSAKNDTVGDDLHEQIAAAGFVGADRCIDCHQGFSWSAEIVQAFLEGVHVIHSDHINAGSGDDCLGCHDPIGDGPLVEPYISPADVPAEGLAAVTCENCHGSGAVTDEEGGHFGIGPMPNPSPNYEACGQCHNDDLPDSHLPYHPEGDNVLGRYLESRHFTASLRNEAICSKCHTDEGGRLYRYVETFKSLCAHVLPVASDEKVQCRTCHNAHAPNTLLREEIEDHGHVIGSAEYATCTNCHQGDNAAVEGEDDGLLVTLIYHEDRHMRVITDSHYDDPATTDMIEGYVVDHHSDRACRDCHNPHDAENMTIDARPTRSSTFTLNEQWATSAHGGHLRPVKVEVAEEYEAMDKDRTAEQTEAMKEAGTTDAIAPGWVHYDWDAGNRQSCQRCHTATGAKNYLDDPENYDSSSNDFSYLEGWEKDPDTGAVTSSGQNEMLYCWGCHSDGVGGLRDPGAITADYKDAPYTYPDVFGSNVCMACHTGRESGETIKNSTDDFSDKRFVNSHYLAAGGIVFTATGYEYDGRDYSNVPFYQHDQIEMGTNPTLGDWEAENGTNGPCVGCHMSADARHLFLPVDREDGEIVEITSKICAECHSSLTPAELMVEEEGLAAALEALDDALAAKGYVFLGHYPYFSNTDWTAAGDPTGKNDMGAAFNFNLLLHDPGAYAHNRFYTKRLIFDSIDWLDNNTLDGVIDLTGHPDAAVYLNSGDPVSAVTRP